MASSLSAMASSVPDVPGVAPFAVEVTHPRPGVVVLHVRGELNIITTAPLENPTAPRVGRVGPARC
jgi:hypothetical protein